MLKKHSKDLKKARSMTNGVGKGERRKFPNLVLFISLKLD